MAPYYLDISALVKRYAIEVGSTWIQALTDRAAHHDVYTVLLTGPEMIAALFRKVRTGEIHQQAAIAAANNFRTD
jgi:predicted nucleic acid-binding protein